jgi:FkbM family methyltransferase
MVKKVWTPPKNLYRYLYFNGTFQVRVAETAFLIKNHALDVETDIFWTGLAGGWEKRSLEVWIQLCRRSDVILDIGANTGVYSLVAEALNPRARVYAFEPVARVYEKLVANMALNGFAVRCRELALSSYDGHGTIYDLPVEHIYTVTVNKNTYPPDWPVKETRIVTKRLATFIKEEQLARIDLIKLDVESHEGEVLEGMGEYLRRMMPTLLIEVWNDEVGAKVQQIVRGLDYLYFRTNEVDEFTPHEHIRNEHPERGYLTYVLCTKPIAEWLFRRP